MIIAIIDDRWIFVHVSTFCIPLHPIRTVVYSMMLSAALPGLFLHWFGEEWASMSNVLHVRAFCLANSAAVHSVLLIIVHWR